MASRHPDRFEFELDGRQIAGLVSGALLTLAFVFAIGVVVGDRLASAPVAERAPATLDRLDETARPATPEPPALTFHEVLTEKLPPTTVLPPPGAEPKVVAAVAPPPVAAPVDVKPALAPPVEPAPAVAPAAAIAAPAVAAPAPPPAPAEKAIEPPPAVPEELKFTVQFGASSNRAEADKLAAALFDYGYKAYVAEADIPGKGRFYRVRVGRFSTKEAAEGLRRDVAGKHRLNGLVMPAR